MDMLTASELTAMQTVASSALDTTCTIQRNTPSTDAWGSQTNVYADIATVSCGLAKPTGWQMQAYANVVGSLVTWMVRLPFGTDIRRGDQLRVYGEILTVQVVLAPQSYATTTQVLATEVR